MVTDRVIRLATSGAVLAVAVFAAVTSYSHIYALGRAHAQDGTAARLLPLSVDGMILAASLVLLHEARNDRPAPRLARFMLWLGIGATVGANVAYGAATGPLGAVISAWPAVAFIGSVEMALGLVRRSRGVPVPAEPAETGEVPHLVMVDHAPAENFSTEPCSTTPVPAEPDVPVPAELEETAEIPHWVRHKGGRPPSDGTPVQSRSQPDVPVPAPAVPAYSNGHDADVKRVLDAVPRGTVPPVREIKRVLGCGQARAAEVQGRLRALIPAG